jgi:uncharacterized protein with HEPN domain
MSGKNDVAYLRDMLQYAEDGQGLTHGRTFEELETDTTFRYAVQYCLLIIGEAANHVSDETRALLPKIPWREIIGMRNWLVHGYSRIRPETIWQTATHDLPVLIDEVLKFLPPEHS